MHVGYHAERPEHEPVVAPVRFEGHAPIRRRIEQSGRAEWIGAQIVLYLEIERTVRRRLQIEHVVDVGAGADTDDMRRKGPFDDGAGPRRRRYGRCGVGKSPSRRRVPWILDGRVVVGGDAVGDVEAADRRRVRITDIGIVPRPSVLPEWIAAESANWRRVIGHLREG